MEIRNGELSLHVDVDGEEDAPPLLLLHGITNSTATWEWAVPRLAARYRLLRLDFRGHGLSSRAPGAYRPEGYLSDAVAVCEQVAGRPCLVVGHSLGGGTAAALAQRRPDLVRAAVLEDPPLAPAGQRVGGSLLGTFGQVRASLPRLQETGIPHAKLVEVLGRSPGARGESLSQVLCADAIEAMATALLQLDVSVLDPVLQGSSTPAFDAAHPIGVPVLVLAADPTSPDCVARTQDLNRLVAVSPLAATRVIRGASHLIHDEQAHREVFMDEVLSFLAAQPG